MLHAEPHCPGNVTSVPLRLVQRSQIVVPVMINRSGPYDFMVDTGAQVTTVDPGRRTSAKNTGNGRGNWRRNLRPGLAYAA